MRAEMVEIIPNARKSPKFAFARSVVQSARFGSFDCHFW